MKKVGILTFQNANNYGALLQAFALQETVRLLGADVSIIDYDAPVMKLKEMQQPVFRDFEENYLHLTPPMTERRMLEELPLDVALVGSDQVWNPTLTGGDSTYFLDFASKDTIIASYAASIGMNTEYVMQKETLFQTQLARFQAISLREASHLDFIRNHIAPTVPLQAHVDPTLLLTHEDYERLLPLEDIKKKGYIFLFSYNFDPFLIDMANLLSLKTGIPLVTVSRYRETFFTKGAESYDDVEPLKWLSFLRNAGIVLTDSYHGLMLSLIFEKPFYVYTPLRPNVIRILDILKTLHLEDRRLTNIQSIDDISFSLDYTEVRKQLQLLRQDAVDYLKKVLSMTK